MGRQETKKHSAIVVVVCEGTILMQIMQHQGGDILDVFGSFVNEGEVAQKLINAIVIEKIGERYDAVPFGNIVDYIEKPEEIVMLTTDVFKITMTRSQKSNYKLPGTYLWVDPEIIRSDQRIRNGDRVYLEKVLNDKELHIVLHEEQYEKWIDAKLISWKDQ